MCFGVNCNVFSGLRLDLSKEETIKPCDFLNLSIVKVEISGAPNENLRIK